MAVRNFWLQGRIDGRKTIVEGGPKAKDGGLQLTLFTRSKGESKPLLSLICYNVLGQNRTRVELHRDPHNFELVNAFLKGETTVTLVEERD